ncbi:MAG: pseudouridine synthase [Bacteroidota bacterium]
MKRTPKPEPTELIRINRYISMCGVASRRKADELVLEGKVEVNGRVMTDLGTKINPHRDKVFVNGKQVAQVHDNIYLVMNKPKDAITTLSDEKGRTTVMSLVKSKQRVYPSGRLDRNTTGVLLLTNDGDFANRLMHPKFEIPKSYQVTLETALTQEHAAQLRKGTKLEDGKTAPAEVYIIPGGKGKEVGIVIHEGRNRQVRRMFESLGYEVKKLDRVAYGPITREGLSKGETRSLTKSEVRRLKEMAGIVSQ